MCKNFASQINGLQPKRRQNIRRKMEVLFSTYFLTLTPSRITRCYDIKFLVMEDNGWTHLCYFKMMRWLTFSFTGLKSKL